MRKPLQNKEDYKSSCNSLSKLYDNAIVDGRTIGEPVMSFSKGSTGAYFAGLYSYRCSVILIHCSCCARNEPLDVSCSFNFLKSYFSICNLRITFLFPLLK